MSAALDAFNTMSAEQATERLTLVLDLPGWVEAVVDARPFASVDAAVSTAAAVPWADDDLRAALAGRPRLGGPIASTNTFSPVEQAGALADARRRDDLAALGAAYEERFGMIFFIRAAGRSAEEVLGELRRRLENDAAAEIVEVDRELREVTLLRMREMLCGQGAA